MIEIGVVLLLKASLAAGGSAWALLVYGGHWVSAAVALPALAFCGLLTLHHSRRLRGKRAEGPP